MKEKLIDYNTISIIFSVATIVGYSVGKSFVEIGICLILAVVFRIAAYRKSRHNNKGSRADYKEDS